MTILGPHTLQQCFSLLLAADGSFVGWVDGAPAIFSRILLLLLQRLGGLEHNVFSGVGVCLNLCN